MRIMLLAFAVSLVATAAQGGTTPQLMPACVSPERVDEIMTAMGRKDTRHVAALLESGQCMVLEPGTEYSLVKKDRTFGKPWSLIRLYVNGKSGELFVPLHLD